MIITWNILFLSQTFPSPSIRNTPVALILVQVAQNDMHYKTNFKKNTDPTAKENKYIQQKENFDKSEKNWIHQLTV